MKAALLPDRGVFKVIGDDAHKFLHGLVTADVLVIAFAAVVPFAIFFATTSTGLTEAIP